MKNKSLFLFLIIIFFAAFLRLYKISDVPPGVNRDEASIGYTAYSLIKTGADEYGIKFPISFQSFGDWKLPFYIYTSVIFVKIFGLSEIAIRLPSALFGIATVGLTFFFVKNLFNNKKIAFLSMFLIALSPWHIHLSRVGSESNAAVFLIILGLILFLKTLNKPNLLTLLSFFIFALTYYTYAGNHIFTTLFVPGLLFIYRKNLVKNKYFYISIFLFAFVSLFIIYKTLFIADRVKISGISIFGDPTVVYSKIQIPRQEHEGDNIVIDKIFHNPIIFGIEKISQNYLNSFSSDFLFFKGGNNNAHNIPDFGNLYLAEAIFLLFGAVHIISLKKKNSHRILIYWLLIAPIASSITKDAPHSTRMFAIFPALPILTSLGIFYVLSNITKYKSYIIAIIVLLFAINFAVYLDRYYVHFPKEEAQNWGYGYKELTSMLSQSKYHNKKIVMSYPETSPYIFFLFYSKYDPLTFINTVKRYDPTMDGFYHVKSYGNYEFRHIDWSKEITTSNTILVDLPLNISEFTKKQSFPTQKVILPNKKIMFEILEIDGRKIIN